MTNALTAAQLQSSCELSQNASKLADAYAIAKANFDAAKKTLEDLKKLVDKTGSDQLVGETFTLNVNVFERSQFDGATAKTFLTEAQIATCTKSVDVRTITVKATAKLVAVA